MALFKQWKIRAVFLGAGATAILWCAATAGGGEAQISPAAKPATKPQTATQSASRPAPAPVPADERATVEQAWKMFTDAETEKTLQKRSAAVLALGNAGDRPDVVHMLGRAMEDAHPQVRSAAAAALGLARARTMIPQLQKALDDASPSVRVAAARSL